jgi:lipopolysaccharide transport system ATP-binding protein
MNAIELEGVCKHFKRYGPISHWTLKDALIKGALFRRRNGLEYIEALKNVTLSVPTGMTVGMIGRNGSGKSTLLRLLAGIYRPEAGRTRVVGRVGALLSLGVGFHPDLSGRENVLINGVILGLTRRQIRERLDDIVRFAELEEFIDAPVRTYSSGMHMRLAFSVAVNVDPDILLLDEVLAVGDASFTQKCHERMNDFKRRGKTIFLTTHDLGTVQSWCDQALWLDHGELQAIGDPDNVVRLYKGAVGGGDVAYSNL